MVLVGFSKLRTLDIWALSYVNAVLFSPLLSISYLRTHKETATSKWATGHTVPYHLPQVEYCTGDF